MLLALTAAALLVVDAGATAGAARIVGKDGVIHACYKARGKGKGSVRLVAKRGHCKRGERKLKWSVRGPAGANGANGANGAAGAEGPAGAAGQSALETKVTELTTRVQSLEGTLAGVTNETLTKTTAAVSGLTNADLTEAIGKVENVTGAQLQEAVGAVADVNALCTQATTLTEQVNDLGTTIAGISLNTLLAVVLEVPTVPTALSAFGCP